MHMHGLRVASMQDEDMHVNFRHACYQQVIIYNSGANGQPHVLELPSMRILGL